MSMEAATRFDVMRTDTFQATILLTALPVGPDRESHAITLRRSLECIVRECLRTIKKRLVVGQYMETMVLHLDIESLDYANFFFFYANDLPCIRATASTVFTDLASKQVRILGAPIALRMDFTTRHIGAAEEYLSRKFQKCPIQYFYDEMCENKQQW